MAMQTGFDLRNLTLPEVTHFLEGIISSWGVVTLKLLYFRTKLKKEKWGWEVSYEIGEDRWCHRIKGRQVEHLRSISCRIMEYQEC